MSAAGGGGGGGGGISGGGATVFGGVFGCAWHLRPERCAGVGMGGQRLITALHTYV